MQSRYAFNPLRHSSLDELTFNRDFDKSCSAAGNREPERWLFRPSYSGFGTTPRALASARSPVDMMDTTLSSTASRPQVCPERAQYATNVMIKHNPPLHGFVTDKVTSSDGWPQRAAVLAPPAQRRMEHRLTFDQRHDLLVNMSTSNMSPASPALGAPRPRTSALALQPLGRPFMSHEPGRHRFFVSDVARKI